METIQESPQQLRGQLTDRIKQKSIELLGYEISRAELRLMPYLQYELMNRGKLRIESVNSEERQILKKWREAGHIVGGASQLGITKQFWDIINEMLFLGYVDLTE